MTTATAVAVHVPLLDLKAQYATIRAEIEPVVKEVIESQYFIGGPKIAELEVETAKYCQTKHAIGCANGSDAIVLALQALGIKAGDAVVCPTFTFFATAGSVHRLGATPVFVDCDPATLNICPESTRAAFRCHKNIKAIVPVHLFGQACDLDAILAIAQEQGVPVVEDAAQAIGTEDAQGKRVGSRGAIGTLSYFPSKNLGGFGDGGMITTNDDALATRMMRLRNHGMEPKYYHDEIGMNSRLDALQAAVLLVKMRHIDAWSAGRQRNAAYYDSQFANAGALDSGSPLSTGGLALRFPRPRHAARATSTTSTPFACRQRFVMQCVRISLTARSAPKSTTRCRSTCRSASRICTTARAYSPTPNAPRLRPSPCRSTPILCPRSWRMWPHR